MTKQEFLEKMRVALNGRVPSAVVTENINYYEDYINVEIRKGRDEAEVLASLGDPRLIAKTIIQTSGVDGMDVRYQAEERYEQAGNTQAKHFRLPGWLLTIIVILVVVLIFSVVFSILSFLAPVLIVMLGVLFMVKLFRDWLN